MYKMQITNFLSISAENWSTHLEYPQVWFSVGEFMGLLCRNNNVALG